MICPICGTGTIKEQKNNYACDCGFSIPKIMSSRRIGPVIVGALVTNKRTPLLDGFISKKKNKTFKAYLKLQGDRIVYEFPDGKTCHSKVKIKICSVESGTVQVNISGAFIASCTIPYGSLPARKSECLALLTSLHKMKSAGMLKSSQVDIELSNPDTALYVLNEKNPRELHLREMVELVHERLAETKGWQAVHVKPRMAMKIAGGSQTDKFPKGIFEGINVGIESKPGFSIVSLPKGRPDIYAQFEASIRTAKKIPNEIGKYYIQKFALRRLTAWIAAVKGGNG